MQSNDKVSFVRELYSLANDIHGDQGALRRLFRTTSFMTWGFMHSKGIRQLSSLLRCEALTPVIRLNPKVIQKPFKPYVCRSWNKRRRMAEVASHFQLLSQLFPNTIDQVYTYKKVKLLQINDEDGNIYNLYIEQGHNKEGSLGIALRDANDVGVFSSTFSLSSRQNGSLYVGAVQGPSSKVEGREKVIRSLTKAMHGLRPKALIVELLLMLAREFQLANVYGVSNRGHIYQSLRYLGRKKRGKVSFDYDTLWQEHGAEPVDPYLYALPLTLPRKEVAELKRSKRRLYTKRYQWLDELETEFRSNLKALMVH